MDSGISVQSVEPNQQKMAFYIESDEAGLDLAAQRLRAGRLVAFPTETVFGLGASALQADAVRSIYSAKGRDPGNPLIAHVADTESALLCYELGSDFNGGESGELGNGVDDPASALPLSPSATAVAVLRRLAKAFWPGPLTIVAP